MSVFIKFYWNTAILNYLCIIYDHFYATLAKMSSGDKDQACMLSRSVVQFFATPWTVACQVPLSLGFSRQEYWGGLSFPSPGDLPDPGIEPGSPALQVDFFYCLIHREVTRDHMACKTKTSASWPFTKISLLSKPCSRVELNHVLETPGSFTLSSKSAKNSWICGELTSDLFCTPLLPGNLDKLNHVWFYHLGQTMRKQEEIRKPSSAINAKK